MKSVFGVFSFENFNRNHVWTHRRALSRNAELREKSKIFLFALEPCLLRGNLESHHQKKFNQYHRQRQAQVFAETDDWFDWRTLYPLFTVDRRTICTAETREKSMKSYRVASRLFSHFWMINFLFHKQTETWVCSCTMNVRRPAVRHISCGYFYVHQDKL